MTRDPAPEGRGLSHPVLAAFSLVFLLFPELFLGLGLLVVQRVVHASVPGGQVARATVARSLRTLVGEDLVRIVPRWGTFRL